MFVGVTTGSSLANEAFTCWQPLLRARFGFRGMDVPLNADDSVYHDLLDQLRHDSSVIGAVITAHKLRVFQAGCRRFGWLDPLALTCEEVNAVRRCPDGSLSGWARDPVSVGRVVDRIWPKSLGGVVCLGAGGTGVALAHHLFTARPPAQFACADPDANATGRLARVAGRPVVTHLGSGPWDDLVSDAPAGSLIVNTTGLGKDRPGSPVTGRARFPTSSVVWDLNYRGSLQFLGLARQQAEAQQLHVHDGWELFCHGWAAALSVILGLPDDADLGGRFDRAARDLRPVRS